MQKRVAIVIPAFNEAQAVGLIIDNLQDTCSHLVQENIVVDDGSSDATAEVAEQAGARVIRHHQNRGYGAALKTEIRSATAEFVLTMDADGQHQSKDVLRLLELGNLDDCDMVVGQRTNCLPSPLWR